MRFRKPSIREIITVSISTAALIIAIINIVNVLVASKIAPFGIQQDQLEKLSLQLFLILGVALTTAILLPMMRVFLEIEGDLSKVKNNAVTSSIEVFRPERKGALPSLENTISATKNDVLIVGMRLTSAAALRGSEFVEEMLHSKKTIRVLFLSPYLTDGTPNPMTELVDDLGRLPAGDTRDTINKNMRNLSYWRSQLPKEDQSRLQIRGHIKIPSANAVLIDASSSDGMIRIEPNIVGLAQDQSVSFDVTAHSSRLLYDKLRKCHEELWANALLVDVIVKLDEAYKAKQTAPPQKQP